MRSDREAADRFPALSSLPPGRARERLAVCIASEDVAGPTRNGGIGSAWAELADFLARCGHDVTILYLRGLDVEVGSVEHWIAHFAARGIRFVPAPDRARGDGIGFADEPIVRRSYNLLCHLAGCAYDMVHVSEWRGAAYLSLLAKARGLAFAETLFVVKASSPRAWTLQSIGRTAGAEDAIAVEAERRSVELSDVTVGGSAYLLRWMRSHGYAMPERCVVQPNVVAAAAAPRYREGAAPAVRRLLFVGRLEPRKGLALFCDAVDRLGPCRDWGFEVAFLGKEGMAMAPGQPTLPWLRRRIAAWPITPTIEAGLSRSEAIGRMREGGALAVMPSLAENASILVQEALAHGVPFVATAVGGTPELIHRDDQAGVLCQPDAEALCRLLRRCFENGAPVARPAYDRDASLADWRRFHAAPPVPSRSAPRPELACTHARWREADDIARRILAGGARPRPPRPGAPAIARRLRRLLRRLLPIGSGFARAGYQGCCDETADGSVSGWVWFPSDPTRRIRVVLFVNGEPATTGLADQHRRDVETAGVGAGDHAFHFAPDPPLKDGDEVRVGIAGSAQLVGGQLLAMRDGQLRRRPAASAEAAGRAMRGE